MAHRIHKRHPERTTLKTRRHEIEQCLSDLDLSHGRSRILHRLHETDHEPTYSRKLCTVLTRLGPVFSAFGLYMSSRVDLLPVHDRLELAAIPDWAQATPLSALQLTVRAFLWRFERYVAKPCISLLRETQELQDSLLERMQRRQVAM